MKFEEIKEDLEQILEAKFCASPISLEEKERVMKWARSRYQQAIDFYTGKVRRSSTGWISAIDDTFTPDAVNTREKAGSALMDSMSVFLYYESSNVLDGIKQEMQERGWTTQADLIQCMVDSIGESVESKFEIFWSEGGYGFRPTILGASSDSSLKERAIELLKERGERNPIIDKVFLEKLASAKQLASNAFDPFLETGIYVCLGRGYDGAILNTDGSEMHFGVDIRRDLISQTTKESFKALGFEHPEGQMGPRYFLVPVIGDLEMDVVSFRQMDIVAGPFKDDREARLAAHFVFEQRYFKSGK
ncbi:hypothetical protein J4410_00320 [Candidatus Woesearchaeota archaeon]|nr:hypothetical protein [Candidatus Woesearchaeota archaeon]